MCTFFFLDPLVAAAFQSLLTDETAENKTGDNKNARLPDALDQQILNANTVKGLLAITDGNSLITRKHALKVNYGIFTSIHIFFCLSFVL